MDFEVGLEQLKALAKHAGWYHELLPYEAALRGYLREEQLYGPAPQTHQDLLRVVDQLNRLCLARLATSFNELCLGTTPAPTAPLTPLARPVGAVMCLYARQDEIFYRELKDALSLWQRQGKIDWLEVSAGREVARTRQEHLRQASLILVLCSVSFFAEQACYDAMLLALQEHDRRQVPLVPVLVRICAWEESPCGHMQALPENSQPIGEWVHRDQAYESIRRSLLRLFSSH